MPDESRSDTSFAVFLEKMVTASTQSPSDISADKPNLLQSFASFGTDLKRKARAATEEFRSHLIQVRRKAPSLKIVAQAATDTAWTEGPDARRRIQALECAGYIQEGIFEFAALPNCATISFRHPDRTTAAFVSKTSKGISLELETRYADGSVFELCDGQPPVGLTSPYWMTRHFHPEQSPEELIKAQEGERPSGPTVTLEAGQAIRWVEEGFSRIQAWRSDRGGWNRDEIRRQRGWVGREETDENLEQLELARHENLERWLFNWLKLQPGLPFEPTSVIDTLTIISDELTSDMLSVVWSAATDDFDIGRGRFEGSNPRAEFAALNTERGEPLVRVWQKTTLPAADYYLPQEKPRLIASRTLVGEALNEGLIRGDLRRALLAVAGEVIESGEDGRAIVDTLAQLKPGESRDLPRQVQAVARLFSSAKNRESEAYRILQEQGIPHLIRLYDSILESDPEENGDILLVLLKVLVMFTSDGGVDRVISAARQPLNPEGMAWGAVLRAFTPEHPHRTRVFDALAEPLPVEPIALALLDVVNRDRESGESKHHPFESAAGRKQIENWLRNSRPDEASRALSAVAALPYLSATEDLFTLALKHPDTEVRLAAARLRAQSGKADGFDVLVEGCQHWSSAVLAKEILTDLVREELIPTKANEPDFCALAEMSAWLAHPNELARIPDELEIIDHRPLRWPRGGEEKPFWLIRYFIRAEEPGEADNVGWGLVGSTTFSLFSYDLHHGSIDDAYAVHCHWEMAQSDLINVEDLDDEDESKSHQEMLAQWIGEPIESARVVQVARSSTELGLPEPVIGLARADLAGQDGWVILDGPRSQWVPSSGAEGEERLILARYIGRQVLEHLNPSN